MKEGREGGRKEGERKGGREDGRMGGERENGRREGGRNGGRTPEVPPWHHRSLLVPSPGVPV